jgi:hypothetical protein
MFRESKPLAHILDDTVLRASQIAQLPDKQVDSVPVPTGFTARAVFASKCPSRHGRLPRRWVWNDLLRQENYVKNFFRELLRIPGVKDKILGPS